MIEKYTYGKLDPNTLTREQFAQMVEIEANCGLEPYSPAMLWECVEQLDTFACFAGGVLAGFITTHICTRYFGSSLYIVNLNVAQPYRGQKIAKQLMYEVYAYYIRDHRGMLVSLDVTKTNKAINLYEQIGFQAMDIPSKNGDGDIVMALSLEQLGCRLKQLL